MRKVVMGDYHTVACDHAGAAYAWGENTAGQLGRGEIGSRNVGALDHPTVIHFGRGDEKDNKGRPSQRYLGEFSDRDQRTDTGDFKPDFQNRRFVFDVAAGGWQSGALVVDMRDYWPTGKQQSTQSEGASVGASLQAQEAEKNLLNQEKPEVTQTVPPSETESHPAATEHETPDDGQAGSEAPPESREEASPDQNPVYGVPLRRGGLPFIRFGYAARGGVRGNIPRR